MIKERKQLFVHFQNDIYYARVKNVNDVIPTIRRRHINIEPTVQGIKIKEQGVDFPTLIESGHVIVNGISIRVREYRNWRFYYVEIPKQPLIYGLIGTLTTNKIRPSVGYGLIRWLQNQNVIGKPEKRMLEHVFETL